MSLFNANMCLWDYLQLLINNFSSICRVNQVRKILHGVTLMHSDNIKLSVTDKENFYVFGLIFLFEL